MPAKTVSDPMLDNLTTLAVVVRSFNGSGIKRERGEVVDVTGWHNVRALKDNRYLADLPYGARDFTDIEISGVTRRFLSEDKAIEALQAAESSESASDALPGGLDQTDAENAAEGLTEPLTDTQDEPLPAREAPKGHKSGSKR